MSRSGLAPCVRGTCPPLGLESGHIGIMSSGRSARRACPPQPSCAKGHVHPSRLPLRDMSTPAAHRKGHVHLRAGPRKGHVHWRVGSALACSGHAHPRRRILEDMPPLGLGNGHIGIMSSGRSPRRAYPPLPPCAKMHVHPCRPARGHVHPGRPREEACPLEGQGPFLRTEGMSIPVFQSLRTRPVLGARSGHIGTMPSGRRAGRACPSRGGAVTLGDSGPRQQFRRRQTWSQRDPMQS